jgi:competence ComEA-like helix-hairpin-helix protein
MNLSEKERSRRNRERIYKICLFLFFTGLAFFFQANSLSDQKVDPDLNGEPVHSDLLNENGDKSGDKGQDDESKKIDLNRASQDDLQSLPGVGVKTAERILRFKEQNGPYRSIEEIMKVKGIGTLKFEKMKSLITVTGQSEHE